MKTLPITIFILISFIFCGANVIAQTSHNNNLTTSRKVAAISPNNMMSMPSLSAIQPAPILRLRLSMDSVNTDEIVIRLNNKDSEKFAENEDAQDMGGIDPLVSLSAYSSDHVALAIDFLPFPSLQPDVIPLLTDAVHSGAYKLEQTQLNYLPSLYEVWLKDAFTGDSLNLRINPVCQFNIDKTNPATFGSKRFSVVIRQNPDSALSLVSFVATKNSGGALVAWQVKNESDSTAFSVERSIDTGKIFASIGGMQSIGTGIYNIVDKTPANGLNQYRLKVQDPQGNIGYSKIVTLLFAPVNVVSNRVKVFPNPSVNDINLNMSSGLTASTYSIRIVNALGSVVKESVSQQSNWHSDISNLKPGFYHIQVTNNTDKSLVGTASFVKN
jgi:hypothetical protein